MHRWQWIFKNYKSKLRTRSMKFAIFEEWLFSYEVIKSINSRIILKGLVKKNNSLTYAKMKITWRAAKIDQFCYRTLLAKHYIKKFCFSFKACVSDLTVDILTLLKILLYLSTISKSLKISFVQSLMCITTKKGNSDEFNDAFSNWPRATA